MRPLAGSPRWSDGCRGEMGVELEQQPPARRADQSPIWGAGLAFGVQLLRMMRLFMRHPQSTPHALGYQFCFGYL